MKKEGMALRTATNSNARSLLDISHLCRALGKIEHRADVLSGKKAHIITLGEKWGRYSAVHKYCVADGYSWWPLESKEVP